MKNVGSTSKVGWKVGSKLIIMLRDSSSDGGFGASISEALQPNPNSSSSSSSLVHTHNRLEESFEVSLEGYGIKDGKASGTFLHFVDHNGIYQVSVLLLENYEPPILACAVNEVLVSITGEKSSTMPTIIIPFIVASSKLKSETKNLLMDDIEGLLYGVQLGPETDISQTLLTRTQRAPSSLKIHHESLACILQFVRILNLPTFIIIGQRGRAQELEVLCEIGELLASTCSLCFLRDKITWNPKKTPSRDDKEPWRALYG